MGKDTATTATFGGTISWKFPGTVLFGRCALPAERSLESSGPSRSGAIRACKARFRGGLQGRKHYGEVTSASQTTQCYGCACITRERSYKEMNRMPLRRGVWAWHRVVVLCIAISASFPSRLTAADMRKPLPDHVPPKRSSQIEDGFGINSDLPRDPYLPWNRWWWTRMFDAGFKWIRIGQYEN